MTPWLDDGDVQLYHGDVVDTLRRLPAGIAQTCITSPPYWGLRSYLEDGHTDKHAELGLEATPETYVERMVTVFREVWRVLRPDGTLWLNLGDSYAGSWGNQGRKPERGEQRPINGDMLTPVLDGRYPDKGSNTGAVPPGLKPKDLVGIPWKVAFALQADGWYLRSDIIWSKPNPMPESVVDRPTKAHEYLFLLTKQPRYFFDADAIREPHSAGSPTHPVSQYADAVNRPMHHTTTAYARGDSRSDQRTTLMFNPAGRNRRSVWVIPTEPFPEAHFATYPQALVRPCILAGTSERGECSVCGAPWVREVERTVNREPRWTPSFANHHGQGQDGRAGSRAWVADVETTGWRASCSCDAPTRPQTVLDPFIGSGTTALVARNHGRRCIGIDLSVEYLGIAAPRLQQLSLLADPA